MTKLQELVIGIRNTNTFPRVSGDEPIAWLNEFDDVTDGLDLDSASVGDIARAVAAAHCRCGTEPDWNTCAHLMPDGMTILVQEYRRCA